uniref:Uncharacterized protein n=1 Tax=viral metagenome TaxID=1070528 RepID=A0A6M3J5Q0_9ZZZZ
MPDSVTDRVARIAVLEERQRQRFAQEAKCMKMFDNIRDKLDVVNREQGEAALEIAGLRNDFRHEMGNLRNELTVLINSRVSAPMSGKERAAIYIALISSISSMFGIIVALV